MYLKFSFGAVVDFWNEDTQTFKMTLSRSNYMQEGTTTFCNSWELKINLENNNAVEDAAKYSLCLEEQLDKLSEDSTTSHVHAYKI